MNRVSPKAVALGFLLVLALDTVVGIGLLALRSGEIFVEDQAAEQISQAVHAVTASTGFLLASIALGTLTTEVAQCDDVVANAKSRIEHHAELLSKKAIL